MSQAKVTSGHLHKQLPCSSRATAMNDSILCDQSGLGVPFSMPSLESKNLRWIRKPLANRSIQSSWTFAIKNLNKYKKTGNYWSYRLLPTRRCRIETQGELFTVFSKSVTNWLAIGVRKHLLTDGWVPFFNVFNFSLFQMRELGLKHTFPLWHVNLGTFVQLSLIRCTFGRLCVWVSVCIK